MNRAWMLLTIMALGCGGGAATVDMGSPEGKLVAEAIENLNDSAGNATKFGKAFAKGSGPAAGKKYSGLGFYIVGKPTVSGDQATAKVRIEKLSDGSTVGEQEWSFVKEGSDWKIKTAPLP